MIICVCGSGYVSKKAAEDLLIDFIVEGYRAQRVLFMLPSYISDEGLKNVKAAIEYVEKSVHHDDKEDPMWEITRIKRSDMADSFFNHEESPKVLIVLDASTEEDLVSQAGVHANGVYDLSKGLYPVPMTDGCLVGSRVALDGPDSPSDGLTDPSRCDGLGKEESGSDRLTGPYRGTLQSDTKSSPWEIDLISGRPLSELEKKEVGEMILTQIRIHEQRFHPVYIPEAAQPVVKENSRPEATNEEEEKLTIGEDTLADLSKTAYYKSKRGNYRKAGNSKARPGEELIHLTDKEIGELPS